MRNTETAATLLLLALTSGPLSAQPALRGFPSPEAGEEWKLEERALAMPQSDRIRTYLKRMSASPHHAGSPGSKAVAEYALGLFKECGLEARLDNFDALLPNTATRMFEWTAVTHPRLRRLAMSI